MQKLRHPWVAGVETRNTGQEVVRERIVLNLFNAKTRIDVEGERHSTDEEIDPEE